MASALDPRVPQGIGATHARVDHADRPSHPVPAPVLVALHGIGIQSGGRCPRGHCSTRGAGQLGDGGRLRRALDLAPGPCDLDESGLRATARTVRPSLCAMLAPICQPAMRAARMPTGDGGIRPGPVGGGQALSRADVSDWLPPARHTIPVQWSLPRTGLRLRSVRTDRLTRRDGAWGPGVRMWHHRVPAHRTGVRHRVRPRHPVPVAQGRDGRSGPGAIRVHRASSSPQRVIAHAWVPGSNGSPGCRRRADPDRSRPSKMLGSQS